MGGRTGNTLFMHGSTVDRTLKYAFDIKTNFKSSNTSVPCQVHWAVRKCRPEILRRLITRGWFVDENGKHNDTPVCVAAEDGSAAACACIEMLCVAGVRTEYAHVTAMPRHFFA